MSRTYRRKGYEPSWLTEDKEWLWRYFRRTPVQQLARWHSDACWSHNCGVWGKRRWAKMRRQWDRQEFARFHKTDEYEPIWFTTKIDTWWWD